jgi:4-nitrophenyl phosphatase
MARRGRSLAVAVGTGIGSADAFAELPPRRRPHLTVSGVDALIGLLDSRERPR